jgi:hypothetical protein
MRTRLFVLACAIAAAGIGALFSCVGDVPNGQDAGCTNNGTQGCPCNQGVCLSGLSCLSGVCVSVPDGAPMDAPNPNDAGDAGVADTGPLDTGTPPFAPSDLPDLLLWLRADQGVVADGGAVSSWRDLSDAGRTFAPNVSGFGDGGGPQLVGANAKYKNQPTIFFPDSNMVDRAPSMDISQPGWKLPLSFYTVANSGTPGSQARMVVLAALPTMNTSPLNWLVVAQNIGVYFGTSPGLQVGVNGDMANGTQVSGNPNVFHATWDLDAGGALYVSSHTFTGVTGPLNDIGTIQTFRVGGSMGTPVNGYNGGLRGNVAEVLVYQGVHSAQQRAKVEDYLGARYGITIWN